MRIGSCHGFILLVFESLARRGDATASAGGMHQIPTSDQFVIACDAKVTIDNGFLCKEDTAWGKRGQSPSDRRPFGVGSLTCLAVFELMMDLPKRWGFRRFFPDMIIFFGIDCLPADPFGSPDKVKCNQVKRSSTFSSCGKKLGVADG